MMTVTIYTQPIFDEVMQKSHLGVQNIPDPEARYNVRAGLDKEDEIVRCILEGIAQVEHRCARFLYETITSAVDNIGNPLPESYEFNFDLSERRAANKAEPLTAAMHNFIVQYALAKFNSTVNQMDVSNKYSLQAIETGNNIENLLYSKQPPRV